MATPRNASRDLRCAVCARYRHRDRECRLQARPKRAIAFAAAPRAATRPAGTLRERAAPCRRGSQPCLSSPVQRLRRRHRAKRSRVRGNDTLLFGFQLLQPRSAPRTQAAPRLFDAIQKAWVVFEPVVEPVLFRFESDQNAGRLAVPRDDDLLRLRLTKITG